MENFRFIVFKDNHTKIIELSSNNRIEDLKEKIKNIFNVDSYIDIDFIIEKPMRVIGKFNVEPGILPRTFDRYELDKFGIKGEINLTFHIVIDYTPFKNTRKVLDLRKYQEKQEIEKEKCLFNISSEKDFPKLG